MIDIVCTMAGCIYLGYIMRWIQESGILKL